MLRISATMTAEPCNTTGIGPLAAADTSSVDFSQLVSVLTNNADRINLEPGFIDYSSCYLVVSRVTSMGDTLLKAPFW
jgi:hypothetical protein